MNISFMNLVPETGLMNYDYFWLSAKSYVEDNYKGNARFKWKYPLKYAVAENAEELVEKVTKEKPDVFMVSLYVWNHSLSVKIAEEVKKALPNCLIVFGGPHLLHKYEQDYFERNWYVDFICQSDGYGEVFLNDFLYQLETDKDWDQVPFLVMPKEDRKGYKKSPEKFNKRTFEWPRKIFHRNKKYLRSLKKYADRNNNKFYFNYESSRGCPFGCTYCEWGGGINSKVNFKPTEYVMEDLEFIFDKIEPEFLGITDANFGIAERDIDITELLCSYNDKKGVPEKINLYGPTKVRKDNLYKIERLFAERNMSSEAKIPVQDLNSIVSENIKRTDDAWQNQMGEYEKIKNDTGVTIRLELILGLPGATIDSFYETYDVIQDYDVVASRYIWHFLPTAPAANKHYMKQFKIETMRLSRDASFNTAFNYRSIVGKNEVFKFNDARNLLLDERYKEPTDVVVSTSSYTKDEWVEMWLMDNIHYNLESRRYLSYVTQFMKKIKGVSASQFYKSFYKKFMQDEKYLQDKQFILMKNFIDTYKEAVEGRNPSRDFYYIELPDELGLDLKMAIQSYIIFMVNVDRNAFYKSLKSWIIDDFGWDDKLDDFIMWMANMIKWLDYDPYANHHFITEYDWFNYFENGVEIAKSKYKNIPLDKTYSDEKKIIDWQRYDMKERVEKMFFVLCSEYSTYPDTFQEMRVEKWER